MATTVESSASTSPSAPAAPWYRDQRRLLVGGGIGIVLAGAVAYFVMESSERKEQFAARTLSDAQAAAESGNLPAASSALARLIATYKGTAAAAEAVLALNQIRLQNDQAQLAVTDLQKFLAGNPDKEHVVAATGLLGAALESTKRWGEAGDAYTKASEQAGQDYLKASYLANAGRAYRTGGMTDKAIKAYRTVLERYAKTPSLVEAQLRLAEMTDGKEGEAPAAAATK